LSTRACYTAPKEEVARGHKYGIEIDVPSTLREDQDLEKLGVLLGHRRRMLRAIRELGGPPITPATARRRQSLNRNAKTPSGAS
jgi:hypothetical protein